MQLGKYTHLIICDGTFLTWIEVFLIASHQSETKMGPYCTKKNEKEKKKLSFLSIKNKFNENG